MQKADLSDLRRDLNAAKQERTSAEQSLWEIDDQLKSQKLELLKSEKSLNQVVVDFEKGMDVVT